MPLRFNQLMRALIASGAAPWAGVTLSLSVTADTGVAPTTTCSGVAPFGVVFDLCASTAITGSAFHDYIYFYDFGDGTAQMYTYGQLAGQTKNRFVGAPVMAYTYLTPGTYTPRVWASNGVRTVGPISGSVTVTNPDTVYGNSNTWYIHDTTLPVAGADGVPVGATNLFVQSDFTTIVSTYVATNRRIRLRAGRTYTASGSGLKNNLQGVTLETYEPTNTGTQAIVKATTTTSLPILQPNPNTVPNNPDKWRVKNIHFTRDTALDCTFTGSISGTVLTVSAVTAGAITTGQRVQYAGMAGTITISSFGTGSGGTGTYNLSASAGTITSGPMATTTTNTSGFVFGINPETTATRNFQKGRLTMHGCKFSYISNAGLYFSGYGSVVDKTVVDGAGSGAAYLSGANGAYITNGVQCALVDCKIDNVNSGEHNIRVQGVDQLILVSNEAANPGESKSYLTVRGWTSLTDQTISMQYGNVSYNYINGSAATASSPWPTQLAPQNSTSQENIRDFIWANNFYRLPTSSTFGLYTLARYVSVRNNVIHTPTSTYFTGIGVYNDNSAGTLTPQYVNVYDNTVHAPNANGFSILHSTVNTSLTTLDGNLGYAPLAVKDGVNLGSAPTTVTASSAGTSNTIGSNNSTDSQIKSTDPLFVGPSTTMAGYALQSGSYAKNAGVDLLVRTDGVNKLRSGTFDMGAMNAPDKQVDAWTLIP